MASNDKHNELVQKLQDSVQDLLPRLPKTCNFGRSPFDYYRYLQGFNYEFEPAKTRLRRTLRNLIASPFFRADYQPSPYVTEAWFRIAPTNPGCFSKQGYLLLYEAVAQVDVKSFLRSPHMGWFEFLMDQGWHVNVALRKDIIEKELETGKQSGIYVIWDLKGFAGMTDFFMNLATPLRDMLEYFATENTEILKKITILNAPSFFQKLWSFARPLIPERTREKIQIPSGDGIKELLEDFTPENLPEQLGGLRKMDLSDKNQIVLPPGTLEPQETLTLDLANYQKFNVNAGKTLLGTIPLEGKGSKGQLEVKIVTNSGVNFGLYLHKTGDQPLQLESDELIFPEFQPLPVAQFYPETINLEVSKQGFYKIRLENSSSWYFSSIAIQIQAAITTDSNNRLEASFEII